jgi:elongation factor Ts
LTISVESVKTLRQLTGAGVLECKRVLEEVGGDMERAEEILRERGLTLAIQKASRETREGLIDAYVHSGNRIGALVEVNCESDFVARTPEFRDLVHNLAMQVAAMSPRYVDTDEIPDDVSDDEDRPVEEVCLMEQPFIKDPSRTIREVVQETIARVGENVRVRQFSRFALGE